MTHNVKKLFIGAAIAVCAAGLISCQTPARHKLISPSDVKVPRRPAIEIVDITHRPTLQEAIKVQQVAKADLLKLTQPHCVDNKPDKATEAFIKNLARSKLLNLSVYGGNGSASAIAATRNAKLVHNLTTALSANQLGGCGGRLEIVKNAVAKVRRKNSTTIFTIPAKPTLPETFTMASYYVTLAASDLMAEPMKPNETRVFVGQALRPVSAVKNKLSPHP